MSVATIERDVVLYRLKNAGIEGPSSRILSNLTLEIRNHAVTVLLGPGGSGKSRILEALSGGPMSPGFSAVGSWKYRDQERGTQWRADRGQASILCVPQRRACDAGLTVAAEIEPTLWDDVFRSGTEVVLLDEPDRYGTTENREHLVRLIRKHRARGTVVVVTHDLVFAREIADWAYLVCAGELVAGGDAATFFSNPGCQLAERFLKQGNCWPSRPAPELPSHFRWILPSKLAGMGAPGLLRDTEKDLEAIASAGISLLVSLTEEPFSAEALRSFGIDGRHFPIPDMGVPGVGPTARLCRAIERAIESGESVGVHCRAGQGRTGTILATFLVWIGRDPEEAVAEIRQHSNGFIQTRSQFDFVRRFSESV